MFGSCTSWLVWNRMKPDMSRMNIADTASESPGMENTIAAMPARNATRMPTMRNPPRKLKSRFVVSA